MIMVQLILGILGVSLGSFVDACAYRIPRGISIVAVPSRCPHCRAELRWGELIPVLSFVVQYGKCRSCAMRIPWRYPIFEVVVASGILILFHLDGASVEFLLRAVFFLMMSLVFVIDWEFQIIPNRVLAASSIIGVTLKGVVDVGSLPESILSAFLCFGVVISVRYLANMSLKRESLGMGDVKLAWLLGLFLGFKLFLVAFWVASGLGAVYGLARRAETRSDPLPFGSFIAFASVSVFTFDQAILRVLSIWF
jgi:prepilin signal peptidase PulO-like enzyme (type II secretory pathway)